MFRTFDPLRDLEKLAESAFGAENLDSLNDLFTARAPSPAVSYDLIKFDDRFELHVDLPGVTPSTIDLTVDGKGLTLTAERAFDLPEGAEVIRTVARRAPTARCSTSARSSIRPASPRTTPTECWSSASRWPRPLSRRRLPSTSAPTATRS